MNMGALAVLSTLLFAGEGLAGTVSSGGGIVLKESLNPWFLANTEQVHYCIAQDELSFSPSRELVQKQIAMAFTYWQEELAGGTYEHYDRDLAPPLDQFKLGTQRFILSSCDSHPELVFQLGHVEKDQKALLPDMATTVGATVRTSYDRVQLRARGFIYVAPDLGSLSKRPPEVSEALWSVADGKLLYLTLVHELGHIFGLPDSSEGESLMSYNWVEGIINLKGLLVPVEQLPTPQVVQFKQFYAAVPLPSAESQEKEVARERVLGIVGGGRSLMRFHYEEGGMKVYAGNSEDKLKLIGEAKLGASHWTQDRLLVLMWLPPEQRVFTKLANSRRAKLSYFPVLWSKALGRSGTYRVLATGLETPIALKLRSEDLAVPEIAAYVDGAMVDDLVR